MRYLVLLLFLLAGCETFGLDKDSWGSWGGKSAVKNNYINCNVPLRYRIFRTSPEICRVLGGHGVDDGRVDELGAYYESLTGA